MREESANDIALQERKSAEEKILKQSESNFERNNHGNGLSTGSMGGLEPPLLHGFHGFFFQPQSGTLHDLNIRRAAVWRDDDLEHHRALIFCFPSLFRVFRVGAIDTSRIAHAACSRTIGTAAGAAAGTRAKAATLAAANPCAGAAPDAAAAAGTARTGQHFGQWIAEI